MKRFLPLFLFAIFSLSMPLKTVNALSYTSTVTEDHEDQKEDQQKELADKIKEAKEAIHEKVKTHNKHFMKISKLSQKAADEYLTLFQSKMTPNEETSRLIEKKEADLSNINQQHIKIKNAINSEIKMSHSHIHKGELQMTLKCFEKALSLLDKEHEILQLHESTLKDYIQFLESLKNK